MLCGLPIHAGSKGRRIPSESTTVLRQTEFVARSNSPARRPTVTDRHLRIGQRRCSFEVLSVRESEHSATDSRRDPVVYTMPRAAARDSESDDSS